MESITNEILLMWTNVAMTNVVLTNVAMTNVTLTYGIHSKWGYVNLKPSHQILREGVPKNDIIILAKFRNKSKQIGPIELI